MTSETIQDVLVLGASGKAGSLVAQKLEAKGHIVRRASRSSDVRFDWSDRDSWQQALAGADAVFFLPTETLGLEDRSAFVAAAEQAGVERIVQLSVRGIAAPGTFDATEQAVVTSTLSWTLLRPCWFAQDFSAEEYFLEQVRSGKLGTPAGDGKEPFIHAEDIADVAVAALLSAEHAQRVYDLSGPELLSFQEALDIIGEALDRELVHVDASVDDTAAQLEHNGHPEEAARAVAEFLHEISTGADAYLSTGVQEAIGAQPRPFSAYVHQAAATGVWG